MYCLCCLRFLTLLLFALFLLSAFYTFPRIIFHGVALTLYLVKLRNHTNSVTNAIIYVKVQKQIVVDIHKGCNLHVHTGEIHRQRTEHLVRRIVLQVLHDAVFGSYYRNIIFLLGIFPSGPGSSAGEDISAYSTIDFSST